jgi:hypothetical protein
MLANEALAQVRNDRLYNDIVSGGASELRLSLVAGTPADAEIFAPDTDLAIGLLELAVAAKNDDAVAELLQVGARFDSLEGRFGNSSILEVLAQQGLVLALAAYIDEDSSTLVEAGADALLAAVAYGQLPAAELLLDRMNAIVGQRQVQTDEALIWAARRNDAAATQMLLARGADAPSSLALVAAVANCSPDSARELLSYRADPLPYYEGEHVASYAWRCFLVVSDEEDAVGRFSEIVQLLYEADSSICPVLVNVRGEESARVTSVLENLDLCQ